MPGLRFGHNFMEAADDALRHCRSTQQTLLGKRCSTARVQQAHDFEVAVGFGDRIGVDVQAFR